MLEAEFHRAWPWLEKAIAAYGNTNTREGVWRRIADGDAQLWTAPNGAVVTSLEVYKDTGLREVHCWLAGGEMADIRELERQIADWAVLNNCSRLLIVGRRGWLRALKGYREITTAVVKDLT